MSNTRTAVAPEKVQSTLVRVRVKVRVRVRVRVRLRLRLRVRVRAAAAHRLPLVQVSKPLAALHRSIDRANNHGHVLLAKAHLVLGEPRLHLVRV